MKKPEKKKPGPKPTGRGDPVLVRILPDLMKALDTWSASQADKPSRPESLRRIASEFLKRKGLL